MPHAPADRLTRVALIMTGLMMCLPFIQPRHTEPFGFFYSEWVAFVLGLTAMTLMLAQRARDDLRIPWVALMPAGLLAVLVVQAALGKVAYIEQVVIALLYLVWAAALMVLGSLLRRRLGMDALLQMLAWCVVAGGMLNAFAAILQTYDIRGLLAPVILFKVGDRAYGNIAQANQFGNYVVLAIASLAYLFVCGKVPRVVAYLLFAILVYSLALSSSISVWLYLVLLVLLAGLVFLRQRSSEHRRLMLLCVAVLAGFGVAQLLTRIPGLEPSPVFASATERLFYQPTSIWIRFKLWHEAWQMFVNSPLLGVGYGQFVWQHFLLVGSHAGDQVPGLNHHAHNLIMQLLAETGIAGTGILLASIALWLWGQRSTALGAGQWWLLGVLGILAIHSMLEYPLWSAYFLGIAAVLLGAGEAHLIALREANYLRTGIFLIAAVGAFSAVNLIDRYYTFETSLYSPPHATPEQVQRNDRALLGLRGSVFTPYVDIAIVIAMPVSTDNLPAKVEFVSRVARFVPSGPVVYKYSALLALQGDNRQALEILNRALLAYPEFLDYIMPQLAQLRGVDKLKIAPYLERVQKHLEQQKKLAPEGETRRTN
jgi:O-antigen ligase